MNVNTISKILLLIAFISTIDAGIDPSQFNVNNIHDQLPSELANTNLTIDDAKELIRDKCINVAGEQKGDAAYKEIETSIVKMGECISSIVNYTAIQAEIDEASPRGELDVVFNKYCKRRPEALECVEALNTKLSPCLEKDEQDNQKVFMRIVRSLLDFVCHKGGDQIALFIAERGPECLESKKDDIQQCINNTFSAYLPKDGLESIKTLPKFVMDEKHCDDIWRLEKCVVEKLETCDDITPANIVESMFRFIKNETICRNTPAMAAKHASNNAVMLITLNSASFAIFWIVLFIKRQL